MRLLWFVSLLEAVFKLVAVLLESPGTFLELAELSLGFRIT
jgi:hypothetical protein